MVYFEAAIRSSFLKTLNRLRYPWGIPVGDSFPVKLQAKCLPFGGSGLLCG